MSELTKVCFGLLVLCHVCVFVCIDAAVVGTPDQSHTYVEDVQDLGQSSYSSSPGESTLSPPPSLDFGRNVDELADAFFSGEGSLQDIMFGNLQDGGTLPAWAKDRPAY